MTTTPSPESGVSHPGGVPTQEDPLQDEDEGEGSESGTSEAEEAEAEGSEEEEAPLER